MDVARLIPVCPTCGEKTRKAMVEVNGAPAVPHVYCKPCQHYWKIEEKRDD